MDKGEERRKLLKEKLAESIDYSRESSDEEKGILRPLRMEE